MIARTIERQYEIALSRGWDRMYWAVDLHGTLILPNYEKMKAEDVVYYPHAREAMELLTTRTDVRLIMYTCSWPTEIEEYQKRFAADGIHFDWVNENPEVDHTKYGYYQDKPYFNVLLDDKAGFDPETHWEDIAITLSDFPMLYGEKMRIWLDDKRPAPHGWIHVRWPQEVIALIKNHDVEEISLDHDLGDDETGTGYDVLKWMEEAIHNMQLSITKVPRIRIHTANPVGRQRMEQSKRKIVEVCRRDAGIRGITVRGAEN